MRWPGRSKPTTEDEFSAAREAMVRDQLSARGIRDAGTLAAMSLVPREAFVTEETTRRAYHDGALPIGHGQTISQPYMVATMTASLGLARLGWPWDEEPPTILDVGTGSGYQAAILAQLGARVISIERDERLAEDASRRLEELGYEVKVITGDGSVGYPEGAPFAGIVVAAAAPEIPGPLLAQLDEHGRLVLPLGPRDSQRLTIVERSGDHFTTQTGDSCVFVPLIGEQAYEG